MELETGVSKQDFPEILHSKYRLVCNERKQEVAIVLLSLSGSASLGNRCTHCDMERNVCVCFSSTGIDTSFRKEPCLLVLIATSLFNYSISNNLRIKRTGIRLLPDLQFLVKTREANKAWNLCSFLDLTVWKLRTRTCYCVHLYGGYKKAHQI